MERKDALWFTSALPDKQKNAMIYWKLVKDAERTKKWEGLDKSIGRHWRIDCKLCLNRCVTDEHLHISLSTAGQLPV